MPCALPEAAAAPPAEETESIRESLAGSIQRPGGQTNLDVSLFQNFRVAEKMNIQFRAEAFNLTNTPALFLPAADSTALTIGKANFGRLTSSQATGRQVQMGLKILF